MKDKEKNFRLAGKELGYWKHGFALRPTSKMLFMNNDLANKSVLEIGGGKGIYCIWASIHGAKDVVNLEPLADGAFDTIQTFKKFNQIKDSLHLSHIEMLPHTIQEFQCQDNRFDLVLSQGSINHLDEESCMNLLHNEDARSSYRSIFRKMARKMKKGGKIIIIDVARRNYFGDRNRVNPFARPIDWEKHQEPETWADLMQECGFSAPCISWISSKHLRYMGIYSIPRTISYFIRSAFRLEMTLTK